MIQSNQKLSDIFDRVFSTFKTITGKNKYQIEVNIIPAKQIALYNMKYRGIDKPTDVLSFEIDDQFGQILISPDVVNKYEYPHRNSMLYVFAHALGHLAGYDHNNNEEEQEMEIFISKLLRNL